MRLRNVGRTAGRTTPQLYLELPAEAGHPAPLLKGFQQTTLLDTGAETEVIFALTPRDLSYYDTGAGAWLEAKSATAHLGESSADLRQSLDLEKYGDTAGQWRLVGAPAPAILPTPAPAPVQEPVVAAPTPHTGRIILRGLQKPPSPSPPQAPATAPPTAGVAGGAAASGVAGGVQEQEKEQEEQRQEQKLTSARSAGGGGGFSPLWVLLGLVQTLLLCGLGAYVYSLYRKVHPHQISQPSAAPPLAAHLNRTRLPREMGSLDSATGSICNEQSATGKSTPTRYRGLSGLSPGGRLGMGARTISSGSHSPQPKDMPQGMRTGDCFICTRRRQGWPGLLSWFMPDRPTADGHP